ncbi:MAG: phosphoserine phosphatase RsbU/P [Chthoniobacter sp.]|jgi:sigma-B regulation protein RsbU (phosphoserine phosphatase)|nr:phosphoserine phosphatase RsbU/P [Chthoniobacter sp.]
MTSESLHSIGDPAGSDLPTAAAAAGRELAERSKLALEAAGVGTWSWEITTNSLIWDDVTHQLFGVKRDEFSGRREDMEKLIHADDRDRVRTEVARCAAAGTDFKSEYRVVWPEGAIHFLRSRGKFYRDEAGRPIRLTGACWDITERMTIEEELARERFLLGTLMEHIPDKIYFKDTESRFIWISRETLARFNASKTADVLGKTDFDFFKEEHARKAFEDEQRIIITGQPLVNLEERETWANGQETWVSTTKMPLIDASKRIIGTFGLSRDITERKRAEAQLARYAEELRRRNEELEEDLEMARELQNALMPHRYPCFPHNATPLESALHFSHFFNPSTAVSGDFFDILELSDTTAGIFICDVMGHGVRAALVAAIVRALVGELKGIGDRPDQFLDELNRKLSGILKQTEIPMFASASYVVADVAKGELRYANAGHPDPLCIRHETSTAHATRLNHCKRGPVLGMFEGARYGTSRSDLSVHDMVLLFTDGLFEVEGEGGELYDQRSLMGAVNRRANLGAGDLCREVLAEVQEFSASKQFSDDVCLVAVEVERLGL